jgi:hypothetical protein
MPSNARTTGKPRAKRWATARGMAQRAARCLLLALIALGLVISTATRPCCGCCTVSLLAQSRLGPSRLGPSRLAPPPTSASACCAQTPTCCQAAGDRCSPSQSTEPHGNTARPGQGATGGPTPSCQGPDCCCQGLPTHPLALPESPLELRGPSSCDGFAIAAAAPIRSLALRQRLSAEAAAPHLGSDLRLHARLEVWLN